MKILPILISIILYAAPGHSQGSILKDRLSRIPEIEIVSQPSTSFKEFYEITVSQPVDHLCPSGEKFHQRVYIGFQSFNSHVIFEADGYALGSNYKNELAESFKANLIMVEHRFFGKSVPDTLNWHLLTVKQAADDYHFIRTLLDTIFPGKWISTGISKGGQAALAYKIFYPRDIAATIVYGTAVKSKQTVNTDSLLFSLSQSICGRKIRELQLFSFKHKMALLSVCKGFKYDFKPFDLETIFDYMLLELPFSFWQNGNSCEAIPDTSAETVQLVDYICKGVPPRFFSSSFRDRLAPSFYMFYHELGYYEYDTKPLESWLKGTNYSNRHFAPQNQDIQFDGSYLDALSAFLESSEANSIFFIYGEFDPWALQTAAKKNVFIVQSGSHKSRIADLTNAQKVNFYHEIESCLN